MRPLLFFGFLFLAAQVDALSLSSLFNSLLDFSGGGSDNSKSSLIFDNDSINSNETVELTTAKTTIMPEYEYEDVTNSTTEMDTVEFTTVTNLNSTLDENEVLTEKENLPVPTTKSLIVETKIGDKIDTENFIDEGSGEEVTISESTIEDDELFFSTTTMEILTETAPIWTTKVPTKMNGTSDGKLDLSVAKPMSRCADGSIPEYSLHGSTYCWSHSVCPSGTACIQSQCCRTTLASSLRKCDATKWECGDGTCLRINLRCDGLLDCNDSSDEMLCIGNEKRSIGSNCPNQFECSSGECVPKEKECNRQYDCKDGSDEIKCDYFLEAQKRRNQETNQIQTTTESVSKHECTDQEFRCPYLPNTVCIHYEKLCDGKDDCGDNSDEQKCESGSIEDSRCKTNEFQCQNGQCVDAALKCNKKYDCEDGTDETTCDYFKSAYKQSQNHPESQQRDPSTPNREQLEYERQLKERERQLAEREEQEIRREAEERRREEQERKREEEERRRQEEHRRRQESINAITVDPPRHEITFKEEYDDGSCLDHEFMCHTGECIDKRRLCDTREDCLDGSDERDCHNDHHRSRIDGQQELPQPPPVIEDDWPEEEESFVPKPTHPPRLTTTQPSSARSPTPQKQDVSRVSDDLQITVYPHEHNVREGRDASFECRARTSDNSIYPQVRWTKVGGPLPTGAHESGGRLTFSSASASDSGRYVCIAQHNGRVAEAYATLAVNSYGPQELQSSSFSGSCSVDERACGASECVKNEYVCDGEPDCNDKSDELNCPVKRLCEPNEFRCANDRCIQLMWKCDGDDDCGDGSDELSCGQRKPGDLCQPTEFRCRDGRQCVPQSFQCDGTNDCQDGSDEVGCVQPTVVEPPITNKEVPQGDSFQLTCRAVAVPEAYINWRLNWGPVCDPPRCVQESEGGVGTLTVNNAQPLDQGAYTCEAINVKGRVLATPDCIVRIVNIPAPPPPPRPEPARIRCDPVGAVTPIADSSNQCQCKPLVTGTTCNQCRPGAFHLNDRAPHGCIKCFCFGITDQCRSSDWHRTKDAACEKLFFNGDSEGVVLSTIDGRTEDASFDYHVQGMLTHSEPHRHTLYWNMPQRFRGNKVTAYGGQMTFELQFSGTGPVSSEPLILLKGNKITLVHHKKDQYGTFQPDRSIQITVETYEQNYERENGSPASREDLLMVLADLDLFLIRATHVPNQVSTSLGDVSWEIAVDRDTQEGLALEVEQCSCPPGYVGLSCEDCAPGYERSGHGPYLGTCVPVRSTPPPPRTCPAGAITPVASYDGQCRCKPNLSGPNCDRCAPQTFNYQPQSSQGCSKCFCSGVTNQCRSSNYRRTSVEIDYRRGDQDQLEIGTSDSKSNFVPRTRPDIYDRAINFASFEEAQGQTLYWKLPQKFLGDKVTSYGGKLKYTFRYTGGGNLNSDADVILKGNEITLQYRHRGQLIADRENIIEISITEDHWERTDGQATTREHLLMVLADLDTALIKLSYNDDCASSSLIQVSLEHAEPYGQGTQALDVEQCDCPTGYIGTSCEDCAPGYRRTGGGLYLGLCERCECHGHASSCDEEYGHCLNCQHNTEGDQCERCRPGFEGDARRGTPHDCSPVATKPPCNCNNHSPRGCDSYGRCLFCEHNTEGYHCESCKKGFYGDATKATPYDCNPCPCPGTSECYLASDGAVKCRNCPAGFSGDRCDKCAPGYTLSARTGGRDCEPVGRVRPDHIQFVDNPQGLPSDPYASQRLQQQQNALHRRHRRRRYRGHVTVEWTKIGSNILPSHVKQVGNQLIIDSVEPSDAGQYRCTGTTTKDIATDESSLVVEAGTPPRPVVTPPYQSVRENDRVIFECIVPGVTGCEIQWHKDELGGPLPPGARKYGNKLVIANAKKEHAGSYICSVRTNFGLGESNPGRLDVQREPWRPEAEPPILNVDVNDPARFRCFVRGVPHAEFTWRKEDNQPLDNSVDQAGGFLTIQSAQHHHAGRYICSATDPQDPTQGPIDAAPVTLNIKELVKPLVPQVDPLQQTVDVGQPARFRCWVEGNPQAQIRWVGSGNRPLPSGARDNRGELVFSSVTRNDAGEYICKVYDPQSARYIDSSPARLDVNQPSHPPEIDPPEQTVLENTPANIRCWVPGNPHARVSWKRRGGSPLPSNSYDDGRGNLRIDRAQTIHEGDYECTAIDPRTNQPQISQPARINVKSVVNKIQPEQESPPRPVASPPVITVARGEPARFHCNPNSDTPAEIHWSFGNNGPLRDGIYQDEDDLVISFANDENVGEYICTATNQFGSGSAEPVNLVVSDKETPPTARVTPRVYSGKPGDRHQFKCHVTGLPEPTITWTGPGGYRLPDGVIDLGEGVLDFNDLQKIHEGDYICTATNPIGEASDKGSINLSPSLKVMTNPAGPRIILTPGEALEVECIAEGEPDPEVEWLHDPGPERGDLPDDFVPITISEQFLRHPSIGLLNSGRYTCKGSNAHATATKDIYIEVVDPSVVATVSVLGGSRQWFPLNQQSQLICAATGQSIVDRIEWTRIDGNLPNDVEDHNEEGLLIFGNFQSSNAGEYECRGYRKDNLIGTSNVTVYVDDGSFSDVARVEISPPGVRIINEGDSIILDCNVRGRSAVRPTSMHWKFYARPLRKSHQKKPKITINTGKKHRRPIILEDLEGNGKFLHLREVRPYDAGLYAVIANMSDGTSMISRQSWVVVKPRDYDGEVKYKWSLAHGGTLIPELSKDQRLTVKKSDSRHDYGIYKCQVDNARGLPVGSAHAAVIVGSSSPEKAEDAKFEDLTDAELICPVYVVPGATVHWTREGNELPNNAEQRGNKLLITGFDESSTGLYTCSVQYDKNTIEGYVNAKIFVPDTTIKVVLNVSSENVAVGDRVWLDCNVIGDPNAKIEYSKDGSLALPKGATVAGSRLLFTSVNEDASGKYECKAHTTEGTLVTSAVINVGSSKLEISVSPVSPSLVSEIGPIKPIVAPTSFIPLISSQVTISPTKFIKSFVESQPKQLHWPKESFVEQARRIPVIKTVGDHVVLRCGDIFGKNAVVDWQKIGGEMPVKYEIIDAHLQIFDIKKEDEGLYQCSVIFPEKSINFVDFKVADFVPVFQGESIIDLPPLTKQQWNNLDLELSIKPSNKDGIILYTTMAFEYGKVEDFQSLFLKKGKVIYETKLGANQEQLESKWPIRVGKWSKIRIKNNKKEKSLTVNSDEPVVRAVANSREVAITTAVIPGKIHIGKNPEEKELPGFKGVISRLMINQQQVNFTPKMIDSAPMSENSGIIAQIEQSNECETEPCQNDGICIVSAVHEGFRCECSELFEGSSCQFKNRFCKINETCVAGACIEENSGFKCVCPINKEGNRCEKSKEPREKYGGSYQFNGKTSFIGLPPPPSVKNFSLGLTVRLKNMKDQVLSYLGSNYNQKTAEFMALVIKDGKLINIYQNGGGKSAVESSIDLEPSKNYQIQISRTGHVAEMVINDVKSSTKVKTVAFPSGTSIFIGGYPPGMHPRQQLSNFGFFEGCINQIQLDGIKLDVDNMDGILSGDLGSCGGDDRGNEVNLTENNPESIIESVAIQPNLLPTVSESPMPYVELKKKEDIKLNSVPTLKPEITQIPTTKIPVTVKPKTILVKKVEEREKTTEKTIEKKQLIQIKSAESEEEIKIVTIESQPTNVIGTLPSEVVEFENIAPKVQCEPSTCGEHGECEVVNTTHVSCQCRDYYYGPNCQTFRPIEHAAKFEGNAYIVFHADEFPHLTSEREETIDFRLKTTAKYGLIFWQGQQPGRSVTGEDYISIGLNDGYLVFSYELGGGAAQITSTDPVNDGHEHIIKAIRRGKNGTLMVDNEKPINGASSGILAMLNVEGDVYIGGVPDLELMTGGLHSHNLIGCVADIMLNEQKLDLMADAIDGVNVKPCESWRTSKRKWMKSRKYRKLVIG